MTQPDLLTSIEALERHYRAPRQSSKAKISGGLTEPMQRWLAVSPFFILSTYSKQGIDCSPRGDKPGEAFRIIDENTIAIPDRLGNNRIDTLRNLISDPRIGLIFLVPGVNEALRVKGTATISINESLTKSFGTSNESAPATVILINVDTAFVQNARAIRRAQLWNNDSYADTSSLPDASELSVGIHPDETKP